jgi:hypothetical protein
MVIVDCAKAEPAMEAARITAVANFIVVEVVEGRERTT